MGGEKGENEEGEGLDLEPALYRVSSAPMIVRGEDGRYPGDTSTIPIGSEAYAAEI
jgi:hypothetical protein